MGTSIPLKAEAIFFYLLDYVTLSGTLNTSEKTELVPKI